MEPEKVVEEYVNPLKHEEAIIRKLLLNQTDISSIEYSSMIILNKRDGRENKNLNDFYGKIQIKFFYKKLDDEIHNRYKIKDKESLFLNFNGFLHCFFINGELQNTFETFNNQRIFIDLNKLEDSKINNLSIIYSSNYTKKGRGLHYFKDPVDKYEYLYSQFETFDCNRVFPCFDQPDIKANLNLNVIAKDDWIVLSNEFEKNLEKDENIFYLILNELNSIILPEAKSIRASNDNCLEGELCNKFFEDLFKNDFYIISEKIKFETNKYDKSPITKSYLESIGYKLHSFNKTDFISTYLYSICAGPYHEMSIDIDILDNYKSKPKYQTNPPTRIFCRQSLKNYCYANLIFKIIQNGIIFYENYFGYKFPFRKYDQIFVPEFNFVACENVGLVTYDDEKFCFKHFPTKKEEVYFVIIVLHELSHMWFGNLITMKWWDDLWLNESFATFISFLCLENVPEFSEEYAGLGWELFNLNKDYAYKADNLITTHPIYSDIKDTFMAENNFDDITYEKGSSVLKQIYKFLGDKIFSQKLQIYFKKYQWKNTSFREFLEVISDVDENLNVMITKQKNIYNDSNINKGEEKEINNLNNFYEVAMNWLTKAGLCEIIPEILIDVSDEKTYIKKLFIKQIPQKIDNEFENENFKFSEIKKEKHYFYNLNNYQTHLINILFIYDFTFDNKIADLSKKKEIYSQGYNLIYENIRIDSIDITELSQFSNTLLPKVILINYEDYGYFKWILDDKSLKYLQKIVSNFIIETILQDLNKNEINFKEINNYLEKNVDKELRNFYNFSDRLSKLNIYKSLYDMVFENKLKMREFIEICSKLILFEKNENIVNVVLKRIIKIANYYLFVNNNQNQNKDYWRNYVLQIIFFMLKLNFQIFIQNNRNKMKEQSNTPVYFNYSNENLIKVLFIRFLKVIKNEKDYLLLMSLFNEELVEVIDLKHEIFYPNLYLKTLVKLFESKEIDRDIKFLNLKKEIKNQENVDYFEELESICEMKLPDLKIKEKFYFDIIIRNKENLSLQTIHNYMNNFFCANQEEILYDFMNSWFFENYETIMNKNDIYLTTYFINKMSKFDYSDENLIPKLFKLAEKIIYHDVGFKMLISRIDKIRKIQNMIFNNN